MSEQEFLWGLGIAFIGALVLLFLVILHERASKRSELNQVLMRNGEGDE